GIFVKWLAALALQEIHCQIGEHREHEAALSYLPRKLDTTSRNRRNERRRQSVKRECRDLSDRIDCAVRDPLGDRAASIAIPIRREMLQANDGLHRVN